MLIIPTVQLSYEADFTHKVDIMRRNKMRSLKDAIKSFIKEFMPYDINEISEERIQTFINFHKLDTKIFAVYTRKNTITKRK